MNTTNNEKATREELIEFLLTEQRSPSTKKEEEMPLRKAFQYYVYEKKDEEIIALKNKFAANTKKAQSEQCSITQTGETIEERIARIRSNYEKTGRYFDTDLKCDRDYSWIRGGRHNSEKIAELWEEIHKKPGHRWKYKPAIEIGEKKISELTLSEVSILLENIGEKTIAELIAKPEKPKEPEKVDVSKIETTLSEDTIRTIINPEKEVIVTNPKWEKTKELLECIFADDSLKRHFAYEMLLGSPVFTREVALLVMNNPNKTFYRKDKIVERMIGFIPADRYFLSNPANIQDLVANCF